MKVSPSPAATEEDTLMGDASNALESTSVTADVLASAAAQP